MTVELKRTYFILLVPAICGFLLVSAIQYFKLVQLEAWPYLYILAPLIFILSVVFAVALPIFYRSYFAGRVGDQKNVNEADWLKFEKYLLYFALVTPYLTLAAHLLQLPKFYYAGSAIMALYAIYYYYPSDKRIHFERRLFRVK